MSVFISIILMTILFVAELDLFLPSLPALQEAFSLTPFMTEWIVGINLIASCVAGIAIGNLGDRYGRRSIILITLFIFIIGSILCTMASGFIMLLLGRFIQGIGIAGPMILGYTVISDLYTPAQQHQKLGIMNAVITIAMALAPVLGVWINQYTGWRGNFGMILLLGGICYVMGWAVLPKSSTKHHVSLSLREYQPVIQCKKTLVYVFTVASSFTPYWVFVSISPILYMNDLGVSIQSFGYYQGSLAAIFAIMSMASGFFLRRYGAKKCLFFSIYCLMLHILGAFILVIFNINHPMAITGVFIIESIGMVFPCNLIWPLALESIPKAKGKISAVCNGLRMLLTALFIQLASYYYTGTFLPLGIVVIINMVLALIGLWILFRIDQLGQKLSVPFDQLDVEEATIH